jgi:hypothetical protein
MYIHRNKQVLKEEIFLPQDFFRSSLAIISMLDLLWIWSIY